MLYSGEGFCSSGSAKLIGTYEMELWEAIERIIASAPRLILDIGAAEGFYAAGFALRIPGCRVVAFEAEEANHPLVYRLAELNGPSSLVDVRGRCDAVVMREFLSECALSGAMLMDVEGAEFEILTPELVMYLAEWHLLIEVHPWVENAARSNLADLFATTHIVTRIEAREREITDIPHKFRSPFLDRWTVRDLREFRPPGMFWLEMIPRR